MWGGSFGVRFVDLGVRWRCKVDKYREIGSLGVGFVILRVRWREERLGRLPIENGSQ